MQHTSNSAPLGYGAFALTLWFTSMTPAGWFDPGDGAWLMLLAMAIIGGCALALAGVLQWGRGHALDASLFLLFAAYWWIAALLQHTLSGPHAPASAGLLGWYDLMWALLAAGVWLAACRGHAARMLFTLGLALSLLAYALAHWLGFGALTVLGGYLGLVTAIVGLYTAVAELLNTTHGHTVLPLGEASHVESPKPPATA
ncbi:MAG TPA: acetate uptake transporter [Rhodanobacteraceae bacterium]